MKCSNGKWKYGEHGNCQFDTLAACKAAAAAIHIHDKQTPGENPVPAQPNKPWHDPSCVCFNCTKSA